MAHPAADELADILAEYANQNPLIVLKQHRPQLLAWLIEIGMVQPTRWAPARYDPLHDKTLPPTLWTQGPRLWSVGEQ